MILLLLRKKKVCLPILNGCSGSDKGFCMLENRIDNISKDSFLRLLKAYVSLIYTFKGPRYYPGSAFKESIWSSHA